MNQAQSPPSGTGPHKSSHPIIFLIFYIPYGLSSGYLTVTLAYLFSKSGISIAQIAGLAAINIIPQIFKFLWVPLVDTTLSLKKWYLLSTLVTAVSILATGIVPIKATNVGLFTLMILVSSFARSFVSGATNGLAAHDTPKELKGRVGGYGQAGGLGGSAIGGGIGLWLAESTAYTWVPGAALSLTCLLCCLGLLFVAEPVSTIRVKGAGKTANNLAKDIWATIKTKRGLLGIILCLIPIGTGAAGSLFAAIAIDWNAGVKTVALVTGLIGGLSTIGGCLTGGFICDKMDRQRAYLLFGLLQAFTAVGMAFCPHTQVMFIVWTLVYAFTYGLAYAAFAAFAYEAIGRGAAASKFELFAGISYTPIYIMTAVAGIAYTKWKANGVLINEAVCAVFAAVLFMIMQKIINSRKRTSKGSNLPLIEAGSGI